VRDSAKRNNSPAVDIPAACPTKCPTRHFLDQINAQNEIESHPADDSRTVNFSVQQKA
jgi:hypothetical protein